MSEDQLLSQVKRLIVEVFSRTIMGQTELSATLHTVPESLLRQHERAAQRAASKHGVSAVTHVIDAAADHDPTGISAIMSAFVEGDEQSAAKAWLEDVRKELKRRGLEPVKAKGGAELADLGDAVVGTATDDGGCTLHRGRLDGGK